MDRFAPLHLGPATPARNLRSHEPVGRRRAPRRPSPGRGRATRGECELDGSRDDEQIEDIVSVRWTDVTLTDTTRSASRLAGCHSPSLRPFDEAWRTLRQDTLSPDTAAHPNSDWVFPGAKPGQPVNPSHLAQRLRQHLQVRAATWNTQRAHQARARPIVAEALGYAPPQRSSGTPSIPAPSTPGMWAA